MNRLWSYLGGYWEVELTGATPEWVLNRLTRARIPFWDLRWLDPFTLRLRIFCRDLEGLQQAAQQAQCQAETVGNAGLRYAVRDILRRPVLLVCLALTMVLLWGVPQFLLFFEVAGNETVEDEAILQALEELGVGFGTYGPAVKPKWIKDHMLNMLPQLQWITVTQNGCMAQVVVRERPETPETIERRGYANVVATQSGLITQQSVLAGQALKGPGDTVLKGETLVRGLVDLERVYTLEYAQAEVYARTWRKNTAVIPETYLKKTEHGGVSRCIWLEIGKQRIKIFGNSGISTAACDKMISRKILSLPGGLELPASLLVETCTEYKTAEAPMDQDTAQMVLADFIRCRVLSDMRAGEILQEELSVAREDGTWKLESVLECHEMIAETVEAKWNEEDFLYDGTNS